jgi:two-component system, response regulator PdtaR
MSPECLMLVEDEVVIRQYLQSYLQGLGYQVGAVASSGKVAIKLALEVTPVLILMDINLPGEMNGIEVAKHLRTNSGIPTIFLTAHADADTLSRAKEAEPFGYLVKPVEPLELRATIEMALARVKLEKEREVLISQLMQALNQVKLLSGLLPICANCKKIRDDNGYWATVERYISEHSQATFTHSICPECVKILYPEYSDAILD